MKGLLKRDDDFNKRRKHLENMSDEELKERFWGLIDQITDPLLDLAKEHTSPSIERSVLIRMGFSSLEAKPLVEMAIDNNLMEYGAGHVVYVVSKETGLDTRAAGLELLEGKHWDMAKDVLAGGER